MKTQPNPTVALPAEVQAFVKIGEEYNLLLSLSEETEKLHEKAKTELNEALKTASLTHAETLAKLGRLQTQAALAPLKIALLDADAKAVKEQEKAARPAAINEAHKLVNHVIQIHTDRLANAVAKDFDSIEEARAAVEDNSTTRPWKAKLNELSWGHTGEIRPVRVAEITAAAIAELVVIAPVSNDQAEPEA